MSRPRVPTFARSALALTAAVLGAAALAAPPSATAQEAGEALRYELRTADGPATRALTPGAAEEPAVPDVSADRTPTEVIQAPGVTLVGPLGEELTWESAHLRLVDNTPVRDGPGGTLVGSWPDPGDDVSYGPVVVEVRRGDRDAAVAGREATHYVLEAELLRRQPGRDHHYRITSELWVLEDLPFTWAPFGRYTTSLPSYDPRLREAMEKELERLGLVARAVTTVDFELLDEDDTPGDPSNAGSTSVKAFEISNLTRAPAPERPAGPVVAAEFMDRLGRAVMADPAGTCARATAGEMLEVIREGVPSSHREAVLSEVAARCERDAADLYTEVLLARVEEAGEWGPLCAEVTFGEGPEAFARSAFRDEATSEGFLRMVSETEQEELMATIEAACEEE